MSLNQEIGNIFQSDPDKKRMNNPNIEHRTGETTILVSHILAFLFLRIDDVKDTGQTFLKEFMKLLFDV